MIRGTEYVNGSRELSVSSSTPMGAPLPFGKRSHRTTISILGPTDLDSVRVSTHVLETFASRGVGSERPSSSLISRKRFTTLPMSSLSMWSRDGATDTGPAISTETGTATTGLSGLSVLNFRAPNIAPLSFPVRKVTRRR